MCCLFGLIDYRDTLSCRQKTENKDGSGPGRSQ